MRTRRALPCSTRTITSASPGTTSGGRTMTRTVYGPALPSKMTSGLPTCAADAAGANTVISIPADKQRHLRLLIGALWSSTLPLEPYVTRHCSHRDGDGELRRERLCSTPPINEFVRPLHKLIAHEIDVIVAVEEPVARMLRDEETRKRPLHGEKRRDKCETKDWSESDITDAAVETLSDEVQRHCRDDEQHREIHRHHVRDVLIDRSELRFGGKEPQHPHQREGHPHEDSRRFRSRPAERVRARRRQQHKRVVHRRNTVVHAAVHELFVAVLG